MADVRMQMVVAVARNEKKKKKRGVKKDIHGYEQKYLFYGDILQIMLTIFSHSYIHASLLFDFVALQIEKRSLFLHPLNVDRSYFKQQRVEKVNVYQFGSDLKKPHSICSYSPEMCHFCVNKSGLI